MFRLLKRLTLKETLVAVLIVLFVAIQVGMELSLPDYMSEITTLVQTPGSEIREIWLAGGKMLLCAIGSLAANICMAIASAWLASNFSADLRAALFDKVQSFSLEEIGRFSTASLITRTTNDVSQIQMVVAGGAHIVAKVPIMITWAIIKISGKNGAWSFSTAAAVVILLAVMSTCIAIALPKMKTFQKLLDDINRVTRENLNGLKVVRAYNAEKYQEERFRKANDAMTDTDLFVTRTMSFNMPVVQFVMNGLALSIYWIGAYIISKAGMMEKIGLFSDMVVFSQYAMQIVMSFMMLVMIFMFFPRAAVAADRINEVLNTEPTIHDGTQSFGKPGMEGEVEFIDVDFAYPDAQEKVLSGISFTAHKGETVAFIGATGSGKSTVINLIPRFYDCSAGKVLVDGMDVKDYKQTDLRNKIAYISQSAILFKGTINSNIKYGDNGSGEISDRDVMHAVAVAQGTDFVEDLEDKYDGFVAQGGSNFSGGQKQRISIARAIARNAEILIFDDSFSALDYKTDKALRKALDDECRGVTRLIVAQRIGTIRDADRIIVLADGKIVGNGTHKELMADCEEYRQIALSQLSEEELA